MIAKHGLLTLSLLTCTLFCKAQKIAGINIWSTPAQASIRTMDLFIDHDSVRIDPNGKILPNGNTVDYWTTFDADYRQGKLKTTGSLSVDYYDPTDPDNVGKLKSIGNAAVTYYSQFDGPDNIGRLKSIGSIVFTYYTQFDGFDNIGKLKSVGNIRLVYYDRFDIAQKTGKLKSIGNTGIAYFENTDGPENAGKIKALNGATPHLNITVTE